MQVGVAVEGTAGPGLAFVGEVNRAAKRDDLAHRSRSVAGEGAGVDAAEAPADHTDRRVVSRLQVEQAVLQSGDRRSCRAEVASEPPAVHPVAQVAQDAPQRPGGTVVGQQARQHQNRVPVADRQQLP